MPFRGLLFRLPWGSENPALRLHRETCADLRFWEAFLARLAEDRFNALVLQSPNPLPDRDSPNPVDGPPSGFWSALLHQARARGLAPYWLIEAGNATAPSAARTAVTRMIADYPQLAGVGLVWDAAADESAWERQRGWLDAAILAVRETGRRPVRLLCRVRGMDEAASAAKTESPPADMLPPRQPENKGGSGKCVAQASSLLYRGFPTRTPGETRNAQSTGCWRSGRFETCVRPFGALPPRSNAMTALRHSLRALASSPEPVLLAFDYHGAHGYAAPGLPSLPGHSTVPLPLNSRRIWTIRNEDFFVLRWGDPDFVRKFLAHHAGPDVAGCLIGSEHYLPARDYFHQPGPHQTWRYAFERQWLFYLIWGRLLADPATPDALFAGALSRRYGPGRGPALLAAYQAASRTPVILATFQRSLGETSLYAEGFLAGKSDGMGFLDLDTFVHHPPLDPRWVSIADYVRAGNRVAPGHTSPLEVARRLDENADQVFRITARQRADGAVPPPLECELKDLESWAWLARYMAAKIRGGVAWETFRHGGGPSAQKTAMLELQGALCAWRKVADAIGSHNRPTIPYFHDAHFSWQRHLIDAMGDWRLVMGGAPGRLPSPGTTLICNPRAPLPSRAGGVKPPPQRAAPPKKVR